MHVKNGIHFITNRCEHEMFLLLPTDAVTSIIQCWFAKALALYGQGLEIYAFVFLSNHLHILCRDTKGTLAAFMWYFQGNVARAINKELGRRGRFFARAYDDVILDPESEDDFWDRYAYTLCNPVKAGLVDESEQWAGWSSLDGALSDGKYHFEMLNKTKLHNATRRGQKVDPSKFVEVFEFELAVPPMLKGKEETERKSFISELKRSAETEYRNKRENKKPLGMEKIRTQKPTDRPLDPSFRPRIKVFSKDKAKSEELLDGYRTFVGCYREIFGGYKKASSQRKRPAVEWPMDGYPPSCLHPVWHEDDEQVGEDAA
jgi:REP element-mobilizing transposase RayT